MKMICLHTFASLFHNSNYGNRAVQRIGIVPAAVILGLSQSDLNTWHF